MDRERELLAICRTRIEEILNWGDSSLWTNSDFELLSDKVFEKTQVRLSISTLKRIWGKVKYDNSPTAATLNALAGFLGFSSWRDFEAQSKPAESQQTATTSRSPRRLFVRVLTMSAFAGAAVVAVVLLAKGGSPQVLNPSLASFASHPVTDDLPNSVIFDYDVSRLHADSVFIQQNWDPRRRERVSVTGKQHTSVYYQPGYFEAKLIVNDSIVKEDIVFIQTKGWKGIIDGAQEDSRVPIYLSAEEANINGHMGVTSEILRQKWGTPVFNRKSVIFHNIRDFKTDGGAFDLELSLRNTSTPEEAICRFASVYVLATEGLIIVPLSTKGCVSEISLLTNERYVSGKENDLSVFGCDFLDMEDVHIATRNDTLHIRLNNKEIFTEKQSKSIGNIIGLRVTFEGAGEVGEVKLNGTVL